MFEGYRDISPRIGDCAREKDSCCKWLDFYFGFTQALKQHGQREPTRKDWRTAREDWQSGNTGWEAAQNLMNDRRNK